MREDWEGNATHERPYVFCSIYSHPQQSPKMNMLPLHPIWVEFNKCFQVHRILSNRNKIFTILNPNLSLHFWQNINTFVPTAQARAKIDSFSSQVRCRWSTWCTKHWIVQMKHIPFRRGPFSLDVTFKSPLLSPCSSSSNFSAASGRHILVVQREFNQRFEEKQMSQKIMKEYERDGGKGEWKMRP